MPMPVTVAVAVVAPAARLTVAGTVALVASLELRLTVKPPAGAAVARVICKLPVWPRLTNKFAMLIAGGLVF